MPRFRFRYSLRTLFIVVTVLALPCWWVGVKLRDAQRRKELVDAMVQARGSFVEFDNDDRIKPWPAKLRNDDGAFAMPCFVFLSGEQITDDSPALIHLHEFTRLTKLRFDCTAITDAGLTHLQELTQLEILDFHSAAISDAGLPCLKHLTRLKRLYLTGTEVTREGLEKLKRALPDCVITN